MKLSQRVQAIEPSATFAIKAAATALAKAGRDIIDLSAGEPDGDPPDGVVEAAVASLEARQHKYAPVSGLPALRAAIAAGYRARYGLDYGPDNVLVTFGGKQALHTLALALWDPGDEVLLFSPYWVSYVPQLELAEAKVVVIPTDPEDGFQPARLEALMALAKEHDLVVISDEIYGAITYDGAVATCVPTLSQDAFERTILVDAVSKTFAMTGWRVGWMVGPADLIEAAGTLQGHSTSGVCRVNQAAALAAVTADRSFFEPVRAALLARRDLAVAALADVPGIEVGPVPQGAFYLFPRVDGLFGRTSPGGRTLDSALSVADFLIREGGVAVVPGEAFGEPRCVRISYALSREQLQGGLQRIAEAVATLR